MEKKKDKRKIIITLDFEKNSFPDTEDLKELEYSLLYILKEALVKDNLIVKETIITDSEEIKFETIII
ncbi:hypothetical protein GCM10023210_31100 [Chryseobacterium ginsengisoli]|uniref:Uncharacterized protein n=1 Tax=Chryseobacterium ginsengisoli TaxID=363853 RepID=A0ABP9ML47_9FLAO